MKKFLKYFSLSVIVLVLVGTSGYFYFMRQPMRHIPRNANVFLSVIVLVLVGASGYFYFMRQPMRHIPRNANVFLSPANGQVISIILWDSSYIDIQGNHKQAFNLYTKDIGESGYIINIMLTLTDIHYQRARDRKSTRLNSSHTDISRMPSSA